MKTLFPQPANVIEARTQANILARAETLFQSGYYSYHCGNNVWGVYNPEGKGYTVNLNEQTCDCDAFANYGDCKHRIGLVLKLENEDEETMWEAICADYEFRHSEDF